MKKTAPRRRPTRRPRRRAPIRRRRYARRTNVPEWASCSVTRTITPAAGGNFATNIMYDVHNIQLNDYDRAATIAIGYQFYRIKHVKLTYKFPYDTFQVGGGLNARPNFYWMIDKGESLPANPTLEALKQMGARPRACDNKPISVHFSPAVLTVDESLAANLPSQYKVSPWLSTDADEILHNGLFWYIEEAFAAGAGVQYFAEIEVQFEFKKPKTTADPGAPMSQGVKVAKLDASPDGVEGGTDGVTIPITPAT